MDPLSISASAIAFVDATARLAHGCLQLYEFWESVREAPSEVNAIKNDLQILTKILEEMGDNEDLSPPVRLALASCQTKLDELLSIAQQLDSSYSSAASGRQRLWAAIRIATKNKKLLSFREGLNSIKSTLMLGLASQNLQRPSLCFTNNEVQKVHVAARTSHATRDARHQVKTPVLTKVDPQYVVEPAEDTPPYTPTAETAPPYTPTDESVPLKELATRRSGCATDIVASSPSLQTFLQHSLHLAVDNFFKSGTIEQLMSDALRQVTSFDCTCRGSYGENGPEVQNVDSLDDEHSDTQGPASNASRNPPLLKKARVCHQTSSIGVLFGSIWIRTSTLKVENEATASSGRAEVITSFIFYPSAWLGWFGFRSGSEASLQFSPEAGWKFNITPVRAVPEESLIFDLCRMGDVAAVSLLLSRGDASVVDTSPKGWTPLHFAAASGHVDLCAKLIEAGADKTALAYQGPSDNALSPIAIWGELCQNAKAAEKIRMLRVFYECLDLADASGEGWLIIHSLVTSMSYEAVPMKDTGVNWLLRKAESGMLIGLGPTTIWDGLQHSLRGFLFHEHEHFNLHRILGLDLEKPKLDRFSQVTAFSNIIALGVCARMLFPLLVEAGIRIGINGFDTMDDYASKRKLVRTFPELYVTWCKTLPRAFEAMGFLIQAELGRLLDHLMVDRDTFSERIKSADLEPQSCRDGHGYQCSECGTSYSNIGAGLVQPRKISFEECRRKEHRLRCRCIEYLRAFGVSPNNEPAPDCREWEEADEELCSSTINPLDGLCQAFDKSRINESSEDPFQSASLTLYRTQGRRWMGEYGPAEKLCGVCFLKREDYLGTDGSANGPRRCSPVPEWFVALSDRAVASTF